MKRIALSLFAAATLAACATPGVAPPGPPAPPAPVDGADWIFNRDGGEAYLAFGTPESDDLRLGFRCRRGEEVLELTQVAPRGVPNQIVLRAGSVTGRYPAKSEPEQMSGGEFLTATARKSDPVIQAFRDAGWLSVVRGSGRLEAYVPRPNTTAVADFFAWCG